MPEPRDKLDTTTVNGPEDEVLDWDAVDWRQAEDSVRRLRQRIFTASKAGDLKKVRNLQKLMLCSRSNALVSVRRVTEVNAGRKTAGVDGRVVLRGWEKADRKSTRLNSSHSQISYAVFCLKKKKNIQLGRNVS